MINILKKLLGTRNQRLLKQYRKQGKAINALEATMHVLSDEALAQKTDEFKARLAKGETLEDLLPEAFATVREVSMRTLGMRHFDVQVLGGIVLHTGKVAEMRTGEGKTLVSTLPAYLNALSGKGVHVITVNDYLAKRDSEWMKPIYEFLGLTVGVNLSNMNIEEKHQAYTADITYGTNNEFGFDYLRDNMVLDLSQGVQRELHYAIIDEVDSILIDEARTPLIISGQAEASSDLYNKVNRLVPHLKLQTSEYEEGVHLPDSGMGDYTIDEKNRQAYLTEQGHHTVERLMVQQGLMKQGESLYDVSHISLMHYLYAALRAHALFQCDVHYIVKDNAIIIVDEHTGRLMPGRRWSDGLHQAVEAKEGVEIQLENQTLATITFQNYFRLYKSLSGMTGTADTEAFELQKIYGLEVVVIPTNQPMVREDQPDQVYLDVQSKFVAIVEEVKKRHTRGQPLLIGTASIEGSELVSGLLKKEKIKHAILNAKQHDSEAQIIAQAGRPGAVTIATNMAGRGTDIVLGGNLDAELAALDNPSDVKVEQCKQEWAKRHEQVVQVGGLHVLGTERHESRRIDNQLRGRSGRQGDSGSSQFYLSMQDNLLRIFAAERMSSMMRRLGVKEGDVIEHAWITKAIKKAQRRVEGLNFDMRKQLLEYDDVANDQRKVIYEQRHQLLQAAAMSKIIHDVFEDAVTEMVPRFLSSDHVEDEWDLGGLEDCLKEEFNISLPIRQWIDKDDHLQEDDLIQRILGAVIKAYQEKQADLEPEAIQEIEKTVTLQLLDHYWKEHLAMIDHLRQGIHLQGYAQKNPAQEYKRESFELFTQMLSKVKYEIAATLSKLVIQDDEQLVGLGNGPSFDMNANTNVQYQHQTVSQISHAGAEPIQSSSEISVSSSAAPFVRLQPKVGRNAPCPCGSGKKYKQCHGKL